MASRKSRVSKTAKSAKSTLNYKAERFRQALHIMFGLIVALSAADFGRDAVLVGLVCFFAVFTTIINTEVVRRKTTFHIFFMELERKVELPGRGALMYVVGMLLLYSFAPTLSFAIGITLMFAFGDGIATLVGRKGRSPVPWNPGKTFEGVVAFATPAFVAGAYFLGVGPALAYALVLALVESYDWGADDNFVVPVAALALWNLVPA
jgi:dolichol kinase